MSGICKECKKKLSLEYDTQFEENYWNGADLNAKIENEHENFLAAHRDSMALAERNFERLKRVHEILSFVRMRCKGIISKTGGRDAELIEEVVDEALSELEGGKPVK